MKTAKTSKRALLCSVLSIALCLSMLIGTTFAWFTDTASTGVNRIEAGTLKIKLKYSKDLREWKDATADTPLFDDNALWEPGYTQIAYLKVVNAGNLALKYNVTTNNYDQERGKNAAGALFYLDKYLKVGLTETQTAFDSRSAAIAAISSSEKPMGKELCISDGWTTLEAGEESTPFAVVVYMPTTVGNEANNVQSWRHPSLKGFGLVVNATQATVEADSFNNTYDENAPTITTTISFSSGTHEVTENMQANGRFGTVQAEKTAQFTINADVYSVYTVGKDGTGAAMAVQADGNSKVVINGGDFRQVDVPASDPVCDLIYALGHAQIEINGGTFKAVTPERTLNCKDGSSAKITVKGGSFYKYDPSHPTLGDTEVVVAAGYKVVQDGDWYKVVPNN